MASLLYLDSDDAFDTIFIGALALKDGYEDFGWTDLTEFNMDNWADDEPNFVRRQNKNNSQFCDA